MQQCEWLLIKILQHRTVLRRSLKIWLDITGTISDSVGEYFDYDTCSTLVESRETEF